MSAETVPPCPRCGSVKLLEKLHCYICEKCSVIRRYRGCDWETQYPRLPLKQVESLYQDFGNVTSDLIGKTLKVVIVSDKFEGLDFEERFQMLWRSFEDSELHGKYLISFEAYTPSEVEQQSQSAMDELIAEGQRLKLGYKEDDSE